MALLQCCFYHEIEYALRIPLRVLAAWFFFCSVRWSQSSSQLMKSWVKRTSHFVGLSFGEFYELFQTPFVVYAILAPMSKQPMSDHSSILHSRLCYVGSTWVSVHDRHDVRWRKLRILQQDQVTNCELVMLFWHSRNCFHDYVIFPIKQCSDAVSTRAVEYQFIQLWQPRFNHPWILRLNPTNPGRTATLMTFSSLFATPGQRLWQKVRRRLRTIRQQGFYKESLLRPEQAWHILMVLSSDNEASFRMSTRLRSSEFHHLHLYALFRLANHCDDPPRTKLRSIIRRALEFRKMPVPKANVPLVIPFLATPNFSSQVRGFLNRLVKQQYDYLVPFHLPLTKPVAGKHRTVQQLLYNHLARTATWTWDVAPHCPCARFRTDHPEVQVTNGHVASPARLLQVSKRLRNILSHSTSSQVFPSREKYIAESSGIVVRWCKKVGLFNFLEHDWREFILQLWPRHVHFAWETIKMKDIQFLRGLLSEVVVHGRDHALGECHVFCPKFLWDVQRSTFGDLKVYRPLPFSVAQAEQHLLSRTKARWLQRYAWGINTRTSSLPIAYLLLKKKK